MVGLRSQFGIQLLAAFLLTAVTIVVAVVVWQSRRRRNLPRTAVVARVLAIGAGIVVIVGTAVPFNSIPSYERRGNLILRPGAGGLNDWHVLLTDTNSLAAVLMIANVLIFLPVAFLAVIGWPHKTIQVGCCCLALSLLVETLQYLWLGRVAATDDVLLNMAGAALGGLAAHVLTTRVQVALSHRSTPIPRQNLRP